MKQDVSINSVDSRCNLGNGGLQQNFRSRLRHRLKNLKCGMSGTGFGSSRRRSWYKIRSFWIQAQLLVGHIYWYGVYGYICDNRLGLHVATWWLPRQLKHNCFCIIIFLRSCVVVTFVQLLVKWWSLQNAHPGVRSVGRRSLVVGSLRALLGFEPVPGRKEAVAGCISGVSVGSPDSRIPISLFNACLRSCNCHLLLPWSWAMLSLTSASSFSNITGTSRLPNESWPWPSDCSPLI